MRESRKFELFQKNKIYIDSSVSHCPPILFRQERDWTCAFACLRTIMSEFDDNWLSEIEIIKKYSLTPKPYFSADIKNLRIIDHMNVIYGCDALESLTNYSHWMVLIGCYVLGDGSDAEEIKLSFFDPYYNDIKYMLLDEFINIWIDAENEINGIERDFLAINKKF